jgi:hypothetical protein
MDTTRAYYLDVLQEYDLGEMNEWRRAVLVSLGENGIDENMQGELFHREVEP